MPSSTGSHTRYAVKIERLEWVNFRNLAGGSLVPGSSVNTIYGENAQGKTNLLEAVWLFTGVRSFRGAKDSDLVARGESSAALKIGFTGEERSQTAELRIENGKKTALLNSVPLKSCSDLIGKFRAVAFSPENLSLVGGGPVLRRNFIDLALCEARPGYASLLGRYERTLFQRNALLKDIPRHSELLDSLDIWDEKLAAYGEKVAALREAYLEKLRGPAEEFYSGICGNREKIGLNYQKSAQNLREALAGARASDVVSGHTSFGPHRDDVEITVDSAPARAFASQGQKRSAVLAFKLAEAELLFRDSGEEPVILLDDVMSELDSGRQDYLFNHLDRFQVFITCCEPGAVMKNKAGRLFEMAGGSIVA